MENQPKIVIWSGFRSETLSLLQLVCHPEIHIHQFQWDIFSQEVTQQVKSERFLENEYKTLPLEYPLYN